MAANVMPYSHIRFTAIYLPGHGNSIVPHPPPFPYTSRGRQLAAVKRFQILDQNFLRVPFKCRHLNGTRTTVICAKFYLYFGVNLQL